MSNLFIPILLGTARKGRRTEHAAKFVFDEAKQYGQFETELFDVRDFLTHPATERANDGGAAAWSEIMSRADGLIIAAPEYNHGYPGELKLLLDQAFKEYHQKPAAICGVSNGGLGASRMAECLRIVLVALHLVPVSTAVYFSNVQNLFDEDGSIKDDSFRDRLKKMFDELVWYAKALKEAREKTR